MTYEEVEAVAILLYGSHWKQQIIADFGGGPTMLQNWRKQGIPKKAKDMFKIIARQRVLDTDKAVRLLG